MGQGFDADVVVSMVECAGRGVNVSGAVKTLTPFQDLGNLRVLGALVEASGLLSGAGPEIIVEQVNGTKQRLSVRKLFVHMVFHAKDQAPTYRQPAWIRCTSPR
jgi:protein involved in polysaccharide export with SLBB domain